MILLIFLISWFGSAQANCDLLIQKIHQSIGIIDGNIHEYDDLKSAYKALKIQQLRFRDVYINRSRFKRKMTVKEIEAVRNAYKLRNLSDENVQIFYVNSVKKRLGELDDLFRYELINGYEELRISGDQVDLFTEALWHYNGKTFHLDSYSEDSLIFYDNYKMFSFDQMQELFAFFNGHQNEFQNADLKRMMIALQKIKKGDIEKKKYCCISPGGCVACPNNVRLRIEERDGG